MHVAARSVEEAHGGFEALLGTGGGTEPAITYDSARSYRERFGDIALPAVASRPRLASVEFQVRDLARCEAWLAQHQVAFQRSAHALLCQDELIGHTVAFSA